MHPLKGFSSWLVAGLLSVALGAGVVVANHHASTPSASNTTHTGVAGSPGNVLSPSAASTASSGSAAPTKPIVTYFRGDDSSKASFTSDASTFGDN